MDPTAIVGIGMTKIEANKIGDTFADMAFEAVSDALDDAGLAIADIDNVITTSNDFFDGRTIACMAVGDASGAANKNVSCVEGDGTFGAFYGLARILSGAYGTTLVTAHSKGSESVSSLITNAAFDPIYERALGMDALTAAAMQAGAYLHRTGTTPAQLARVSVKNHGNARQNPRAQLPLKLTVADVLNSELIAGPLHKLDCSPVSDACCAVILAAAPRVKKARTKPVWIQGVNFCADAYFLGDRDLTRSPALVQAAKKAYAMAGVKDPKKDLHLAEVYDAFTYMELMWLEGLGLAPDGQAGKQLESGRFDLGGAFPVNPSGGLLAGHPVIAGGLIRIAEAVRQLRHEAGGYQVDGARRAVAHGINGICGQSHCVWVLGRDK
jgi:acetyl-CoA C-acetyltransferase